MTKAEFKQKFNAGLVILGKVIMKLVILSFRFEWWFTSTVITAFLTALILILVNKYTVGLALIWAGLWSLIHYVF